MVDQEYGPSDKTYEIRLKGHLDESWRDLFEDFNFTHESDGTTTLKGKIIDQSALHSVLKKVRDLGLPLLSVQCIEPNETTGTEILPPGN